MKVLTATISDSNDLWVNEYISFNNYDVTDTILLNKVRLAIDFYINANTTVPSKELIFSQLNGIDFRQNVELVLLEENDLLDQVHVRAHGACVSRKGAYFAIHNPICPLSPSQRGISDQSFSRVEASRDYLYATPKILTTYVVTHPTKALRSVAKPVEDSWSMRVPKPSQRPAAATAQPTAATVLTTTLPASSPVSRTQTATSPVSLASSHCSTLTSVSPASSVSLGVEVVSAITTGGGVQLYTGDKGKYNIMCFHELKCKILIEKIKDDAKHLETLEDNDIEILSNQIAILSNMAQFAKDRKDVENFEYTKRKLVDIYTTLTDADQKITQTQFASVSWFKSIIKKITQVISVSSPYPLTPLLVRSFSYSSLISTPLATTTQPTTPSADSGKTQSASPMASRSASIDSLKPCCSSFFYSPVFDAAATSQRDDSRTDTTHSRSSNSSLLGSRRESLHELAYDAIDRIRTSSPL